MTTVANDVLQMFQALQGDTDKARPDSGTIWRPKDGESPQLVRDIQIETAGVTIKCSDGQVIPAFRATAHYRTLPGGHPEDPINTDWPGKPCVYPIAGLAAMPGDEQKGTKAQARMNYNRFLGILKAVLGKKYSGNIAADISTAKAQLADSSKMTAIIVKCQRDHKKTGTGPDAREQVYFQEYGVKSLSSDK